MTEDPGNRDFIPKGWPPEKGPGPIPIGRNRQVERIILVVLIAVLLLGGLSSLFYSVQADSKGVVLRFGRYIETTDPGLHWKLPWPIDEVVLVPVEQVQSIEFGFSTASVNRRSQFDQTPRDLDTARMLSGDLNLAHVEWIVQYRIGDPNDFLFKIGGSVDQRAAVSDLLEDVSETVMRKLVGDRSVDQVITIGREEIATAAKKEIQDLLDGFHAGVEVMNVKLQAASPPDKVKDAFDAVNRARQNKSKVINEAEGQRNREIPAARGKRDQMISSAS